MSSAENGGLQYSGSRDDFLKSEFASKYVAAAEEDDAQDRPGASSSKKSSKPPAKPVNKTLQKVQQASAGGDSSDSSDASSEESESDSEDEAPVKKPRKQVLAEQRAVGSISWGVWTVYVKAAGSYFYWFLTIAIFGEP